MVFLSPEEIEKNQTWLLENASAPVRYLTHRHILKTDPESAAAQALWNEVRASTAANEIFSRQNHDGTWFSGGPWGPRGYARKSGYTMSRPKFVTTAWILPYLGEMGFTVEDDLVRQAYEHVIHEELTFHPDAQDLPDSADCCGLSAIPLRALASVGGAADERLRTGWEWIALCQRGDGGWLNPRHLPDAKNPSTTAGRWPWDRSCAWGSYFVAQALYYAGDVVPIEQRVHALEFLRWHLAQAANPSHIQTWVWHGHNIVKELLMFSETGFNMNAEPIRGLLDWLKSFYHADEGVSRAQAEPINDYVRLVSTIVKEYEIHFSADYWTVIAKTSPSVLRYHLYHLIEDDWLTYTATRIGINCLNNQE
ncbi:MAG: hypothetical protein JW750_03785 [Anaerolineaceae bacterium]|nr:hypothetical protein [Anaerolineaceae bacterium]